MTRLTIEYPEETHKRIDDLMESLGAKDHGEVITIAIQVLSWMERNKDNMDVYIRKAEGE